MGVIVWLKNFDAPPLKSFSIVDNVKEEMARIVQEEKSQEVSVIEQSMFSDSQ